MKIKIIVFPSVFFAGIFGAIQVAAFANISEPIAPTAPLPPPKPEAEFVKPVKKDIPQAIHIIDDNTFIVAPREAPLPLGTISGPMFRDDVVVNGEEPAYMKEQNLMPKIVAPIAKVPTVKQMKAPKKELKKKLVKAAIKKLKPQKKIAIQINYNLDIATPNAEDKRKLAAFAKKLEGKKLIQLNIYAQTTKPPLGATYDLAQTRFKMMMGAFKRAKIPFDKVKIAQILLQGETNQFVRLEVVTR